jgi:peptidylprolyl isomerase
MATAKTGDTVLVHYTGKLQDGTIFDSSVDRQPLEFAVGQGQVIPGFDQAVTGMSPGDSKTVQIPADQAYGPARSEMVMVVDRQQIPTDLEVSVGAQLQLQHSSGQVIPVMIKELTTETVTLDANHPLAGEDLTFDINLVSVNP